MKDFDKDDQNQTEDKTITGFMELHQARIDIPKILQVFRLFESM